jgi:23S rRNA (uracil1939-C5)-methyltransferase
MMTAISAGKGELRGASRVTLRAGIRTGEELRLIDDQFGRIHEEVAGRRLRISGRAFFQNNTDGAEVLVDLVTRALAPQAGEMLLDGYAGGGLFAATVGMGCEVVAVESDPLTVTDLAFNTDAEILPGQLERVSGLPPHWDVAVVDPPRTGLGVEAVKVLVGGGPRTIAYVSCDPASFARDAALLDVSGYHLEWVQPLDLFPQTFHIEVVGKFVAR